MQSIDADNLRKIIDEARGILRPDIIEAMEAAANEIDRLMLVVIRYQQERRAARIGAGEAK